MKKISLLFLLLGMLFLNKAIAQSLPNADFEQTDTINSFPFFTDWSGDEYGSGISSSAQSGNFSLSVWNWYYYARGYAMNGTPNFYLQAYKSGTPYTQKATKLNGFYTYDTVDTYTNDDTAIVAVLLKKFNTSTQSIDTVGYGLTNLLYQNPGDGFAPFEVVINDLQPGIQPDSIVVFVQSSKNGFCSNSSPGTCLYLTVDNLSLVTPVGITDIAGNKIEPKIFPNPSNGNFTLEFGYEKMKSIKIVSIEGKLVFQSNLNSNNLQQISLPELKSGVYLTQITTETGFIYTEQLVIE